MAITFFALGLLLSAGCADSPGADSDGEPILGDTAGAELGPCGPELTLSPTRQWLEPFELVPLRPAGGTGDWQLSLLEGSDTFTLNPDDAVLIAGGAADVSATVELRDAGCTGSAQAQVQVVAPLELEPTELTLRPGVGFQYQISGGSGSVGCALLTDGSGASLSDDCAYTAGPDAGLDRVRVTDLNTGAQRDAQVHVDPGAELRMPGEGQLYIPLGARFVPQVQGGSGQLELEVLQGALQLDGEGVQASVEGSSLLAVRDRFAGMELQVPVSVLQARVPELGRDGERSAGGMALPLGDVNGDGYDDLAFGFIELSVGAWYGGGAVIWAGGPGGPDPTPTQVLTGHTRSETAGRGLAAGDVNNDGQVDLLLGADKADPGQVNSGAVRLHLGIEGGFFEPEPARELQGQLEYERFGSAVALCDFDDDGWLDLAVGAEDSSDLAVATPAEDQGAVHVFRGSADGYADRADFVLYGELPDGSEWAGRPGMHLGGRLVTADIDGDGLCDLAAGAPDASWTGGDEDGVVVVFAGTQQDGLLLTRDPAWVLASAEGVGEEFGRRLHATDVDGDGAAELAVAAWESDQERGSGGAVYLFAGGAFPSDPTRVTLASAAAWTALPETGLDYLGTDVHLGDLDGDGHPELLVGAYRAEEPDADRDAGQTLIWDGQALADHLGGGAAPSPLRKLLGPAAYARLGQVNAAAGDMDGDGQGDVFSFAGRDDSFGVEVGAPYLARQQGAGALEQLELPGEAAGHEIGRAMALLDMDGDGHPELFLGAPNAGVQGLGGNAGAVQRYAGSSAGLSPTPEPWAGGHSGHSASDRFGYKISPIGDFDGDGVEDLAVLARRDSRLSSYPSAWGGAACDGYASQAGSVWVYRGSESGQLNTEPAFVFHSDDPSGYLYELAGVGDIDGDGYDDLAVGSGSWGAGGTLALLHGRSGSSGTQVICDAQRLEGFESFDRMGWAVTGLGDIDGDGCDELAFSATGEEFHSDWYNQGAVRVLWGSGAGCRSQAEVSTLALRVVGTGAGASLAGGQDVDGDGVPDMVVGATDYRVTFAEQGAAWLVPGWWLLLQPTTPLRSGGLPTPEQSGFEYLLPDDGEQLRYGLIGAHAGARFGEAVALVPDPLDGSRWAVAVGVSQGDLGGTALAGGVAIHRFLPGLGLDPVPWGLMAGESHSAGGQLGAELVAVPGPSSLDGPTLLVGAPSSSVGGLNQGAAYVLDLTP